MKKILLALFSISFCLGLSLFDAYAGKYGGDKAGHGFDGGDERGIDGVPHGGDPFGGDCLGPDCDPFEEDPFDDGFGKEGGPTDIKGGGSEGKGKSGDSEDGPNINVGPVGKDGSPGHRGDMARVRDLEEEERFLKDKLKELEDEAKKKGWTKEIQDEHDEINEMLTEIYEADESFEEKLREQEKVHRKMEDMVNKMTAKEVGEEHAFLQANTDAANTWGEIGSHISTGAGMQQHTTKTTENAKSTLYRAEAKKAAIHKLIMKGGWSDAESTKLHQMFNRANDQIKTSNEMISANQNLQAAGYATDMIVVSGGTLVSSGWQAGARFVGNKMMEKGATNAAAKTVAASEINAVNAVRGAVNKQLQKGKPPADPFKGTKPPGELPPPPLPPGKAPLPPPPPPGTPVTKPTAKGTVIKKAVGTTVVRQATKESN